MRPQSQRLKIKCAQNLIVINGSLNCDRICIFYFFSVTLHWSWFIHPNHAPRIIKTSLICNILVFSPTRSTGSCLLWLVDSSRCYTGIKYLISGPSWGIYVRSEPDLVLFWCCKSLKKTSSNVILWYCSTRSVTFLHFLSLVSILMNNSICNGRVFCHNDNQ